MLTIQSLLRMFKGVSLAMLFLGLLIACENRGESKSESLPLDSTSKSNSEPAKKTSNDETEYVYHSPIEAMLAEGSFEEVALTALTQDKIMAVFIHLPGCLHCEVFIEETLGNEKVKQWLKKNALLYKTADLMENEKLSKRYAQAGRAYKVPTMLFLRGNGDFLSVKESNFNTQEISVEAFMEAATAAEEKFR